MFAKMDGRRLTAVSSAEVSLDKMLTAGVREQPDVAAIASLNGDTVSILVWHYHDDDVPGPDAAVHLALTGLPRSTSLATVTHYRIDEQHSNAYAEWKRLGSPLAPDQKTYLRLEQAGQLATLASAETARVSRGGLELTFTLPRQGVSLVQLALSRSP
jgi:xylan 1,4-beta-xylosidase